MLKSRTLLLAGAASTALLLSMSTAGPAMAAAAVVVTDRETVQIYMTPTGEVKVARVYDQVTVTGAGTVDIENPVSTEALRNLEGLSGVDVENGNAVATVNVDGQKRLRTVSTFDGELPVTIKPTYKLDGKVYEDPEDLVGKSGELTVLYRVENITAVPTTLTVTDGEGNEVQKQVDVPMPLAGQLVTVLPKNFYAARSDQASVSADGRGGTRMTFTMTLLPPVGSAIAEVGYTAQVKDAIIPRATVTIAVVQPLKNPSLSTAAASYQGGATTGATLTAGAEEIDANLLKLRDGAGELLGGLLLLSEGADELNQGLSEEAAPGANELADGAGQASAGADELSAGLDTAASGSEELATGIGKLSDGNQALANGFSSPTGKPDLVTGSEDLASGLGLISGGLAELAGVEGLPKAYAGMQVLRTGIDHPVGASGSSDPGGLLQGLQQIAGGLSNPACTFPGTTANPCGVKQGLGALDTGLTTIKGGLGQVSGGLSNPACTFPGTTTNPCGVREGVAGIQSLTLAAYFGSPTPCPGTAPTVPVPTALPVTACDYIANAYYGLTSVQTGVSTLSSGVTDLIAGVTTAQAGLTTIRTGVDLLSAGAVAARNGVSDQILPGIDLLLAGLSTAVTGVTLLSDGASTAATGSGTLAEKIAEAGDGSEQLAEGADEAEVGSKALADGLEEASAGSDELADGNEQIADGASELATGLDAAAAGSAQIDDGLEQATAGTPALVNGAQRLSDEGTKKLVEAGNETALDFGTKYAMIAAMADMTKDGGLPYGAPEGAIGSAAYSFELAAANHEESRNITRGLLAIGALGLGALLSTVIRARYF